MQTSAVVVAAALPVNHTAKAQAVDDAKRYEAENGDGTVWVLGAYAWDAGPLVAQAIPATPKAAQPGTRLKALASGDASTRSVTLQRLLEKYPALELRSARLLAPD